MEQFKLLTIRRLGAALLLTAAASAMGQPASSPTSGKTGSATTPAAMPPGATSARGNKASVPASGASGAMSGSGTAIDPTTGSTPGLPPGAKSAEGNKAATPKGSGLPASGAKP